jgi:hypothetical protein
MQLELVEDVMTCYPNQLENLNGLDNTPDITLINLWDLRKWNLATLHWEDKDIENPVLLSNWVLEFVRWSTWKKHLITTLRDGWAADELTRTTAAWRNTWENLQEELEREFSEESPFLCTNEAWEYTLVTHSTKQADIEALKHSIELFLERKYNLDKNNEEHAPFIKIFERSFPGIDYNDLWDILKDIVVNNRFEAYENTWINDSPELEQEFEWVKSDMKQITLWEHSGKYFVYFDKDNNTIEYRDIRELQSFPEWVKLIWNRPSRLYLESQNQWARTKRIDRYNSGVTPTVEYFSNQIKNSL